LTTDELWSEKGWSLAFGREESPSCTEQGCPVKAGERWRHVDSPDWRSRFP